MGMAEPAQLNQIFGFSSQQSIHDTYKVALRAREIEGCFVECGVASGGGSAPMSLVLKEVDDKRVLHLFDSFEGLPHAGPEDTGDYGVGTGIGNFAMDPNLPVRERLKTTGATIGTIANVTHHFGVWGVTCANIKFHEGWFQDTVPGVNLAPIAFLRLDGDLYESTMLCLDELYDQVAPGGFIWLDELGMDSMIGGKKAAYDFFEKRGEEFPELDGRTDTRAGWWIKR